jgi:hypothetical protein
MDQHQVRSSPCSRSAWVNEKRSREIIPSGDGHVVRLAGVGEGNEVGQGDALVSEELEVGFSGQ